MPNGGQHPNRTAETDNPAHDRGCAAKRFEKHTAHALRKHLQVDAAISKKQADPGQGIVRETRDDKSSSGHIPPGARGPRIAELSYRISAGNTSPMESAFGAIH
jgi:hypothetical protein